MEFINNLLEQIAKPYRVETIITNGIDMREIITTYAVTLDEAIGQIARAKELSGSYFESARIFDDCGGNIFEIDETPKAWVSAMNF